MERVLGLRGSGGTILDMGPDEILAARERVLSALGFTTYNAYLLSPLWRSIRTRAMTRFRWRCRLCQDKATEVHHLDYLDSTMRGRNPGSLVPVCHGCHEWIEFGESIRTRKRWDPAGAFSRYLQLLHAADERRKPEPPPSFCCATCGAEHPRHRFRHDKKGILERPLICPKCAGKQGSYRSGKTKKQLKRAAFRARKAQETDRKYGPRPH